MISVAVCYSGCLSTWKECWDSQEDALNSLQELWKDNIKVVKFASIWDFNNVSYNTPDRQQVLASRRVRPHEDTRMENWEVDCDELQDFTNCIANTGGTVRIFPEREYKRISKEVDNWAGLTSTKRLETLNWLKGSTFLFRDVLSQKRCYERSKNRRFDVVFRFRPDATVGFTEGLSNFNPVWQGFGLYGNIIYCYHRNIGRLLYHIADIVFYGDSQTMDTVGFLYEGGDILRSDNPDMVLNESVVEEDFYASCKEEGIPVFDTQCSIQAEVIRQKAGLV